MNDKELAIEDVLCGIKNVKKEEHCYLTDEARFILLDYINKLQSNWNSLRKELYQANRELVTNELVNGKELINNIINIMNELEGEIDNE